MAVGVVASVLVMAACGGGGKPAESPGTDDSSGHTSAKDDDETTATPSSTPTSPPASEDSSSSEPAAGNTPYDKEAVNIELKRAARQVKANCGSATDDSGNATGPWGKTKLNVVLGRNGHVKQVTLPAPYDGKPIGICTVHAFQKIQFPPYAAPSDVALDLDIELVQPKK